MFEDITLLGLCPGGSEGRKAVEVFLVNHSGRKSFGYSRAFRMQGPIPNTSQPVFFRIRVCLHGGGTLESEGWNRGSRPMKKFRAQWPTLSGLFALILFAGESGAGADRGLGRGGAARWMKVCPRSQSCGCETSSSATSPRPTRKWRQAKLGEALLAAGEAEEALKVLRGSGFARPAGNLALARPGTGVASTMDRGASSLPKGRRRKIVRPCGPPAFLVRRKLCRALQRFDEALQMFGALLSDPQWNDRAQLRSIELLLDKRDNTGARRILDKTRPSALADKKEKRYLQGRLEAQLNHHERAIELYQTILRRPEGASRAVLIATLCAVARISSAIANAGNGRRSAGGFYRASSDGSGAACDFRETRSALSR